MSKNQHKRNIKKYQDPAYYNDYRLYFPDAPAMEIEPYDNVYRTVKIQERKGQNRSVLREPLKGISKTEFLIQFKNIVLKKDTLKDFQVITETSKYCEREFKVKKHSAKTKREKRRIRKFKENKEIKKKPEHNLKNVKVEADFNENFQSYLDEMYIETGKVVYNDKRWLQGKGNYQTSNVKGHFLRTALRKKLGLRVFPKKLSMHSCAYLNHTDYQNYKITSKKRRDKIALMKKEMQILGIRYNNCKLLWRFSEVLDMEINQEISELFLGPKFFAKDVWTNPEYDFLRTHDIRELIRCFGSKKADEIGLWRLKNWAKLEHFINCLFLKYLDEEVDFKVPSYVIRPKENEKVKMKEEFYKYMNQHPIQDLLDSINED